MSTNRQKTTELVTHRFRGHMQVWHLVEDCFLHQFNDEANWSWPRNFELVALLDTFSLHEAFKWGNERDGWSRPEVRLYPNVEFLWGGKSVPRSFTFDVHPRSTSMGDVMITPEGVPYRVEPGHFKKLIA
jgi:hypothetical protein